MPRWEGHLLKFTPWKQESALRSALPTPEQQSWGLCAESPEQPLGSENHGLVPLRCGSAREPKRPGEARTAHPPASRRQDSSREGPVWQVLSGHKRSNTLAVELPRQARGTGTLIPSVRRLVWAGTPQLRNAKDIYIVLAPRCLLQLVLPLIGDRYELQQRAVLAHPWRGRFCLMPSHMYQFLYTCLHVSMNMWLLFS